MNNDEKELNRKLSEKEEIRLQQFNKMLEELDEYINWYNCKRIKLSLCGLSPIEYRQRLGCAV